MTKQSLLLCISVILLGACERRVPPPPPSAEMETACMMERREKIQKMANLCAARGAEVQDTLQVVRAAQSGKSMNQMKLALGKAAEELQRMEEHLTMCREHLSRPMSGRCPCMRHPEGKCGPDMIDDPRI